MAIALSDEIKTLLDQPNFAHLATIMPDGSPQVAPVWVMREDNRIVITTGEGYTGKDFPWRTPEGRVALVIEVDRARYQKLPFTHTPPGRRA